MSQTKYFLYADDLPIETFSDPARAYQRRRQLADHGKETRLFALHPDKHVWREWVRFVTSQWVDVDHDKVPFRVVMLDRP